MTLIITNERERSRFMRFALVGIIGAIIDFGVMNLLRQLFFTPLVVAGTVSFICAVLSNFVWNRYWTYPDSRSKPILHQLLIFSLVSVIGLLIRIPTLYLLEPVFLYLFSVLQGTFSFINPKWLADNFTLAIAVIIVMFWNFFVNRYWTYNDVE
jgi:putative flippase GtrA